MKLAGWQRLVKSTIDRGDGLERPIIRKWVGVRGEQVSVRRHHTIDIDGITLTDEEDVADDESLWYIETSWSDRISYQRRDDAIDGAIELMRDRYTTDEIDEAKAQIDSDNDYFDQV